ncbi:U-box domain-containing protein [Musa troglodytarum]|uniref:RING-type E3 ubiquitin transferase n=1 Tax=Musa troglodytarum TaxID=320322 RepID=A0A9E7JC09_9LILI|nr:U-box domain-containing protein [Musa troglodytarum]
MASWLKVAEDLFEVVDRRAKLVASELADEQSGLQASASNAEEVYSRRPKAKEKGHAKSSSIENLVSIRPEHDQKHKEKSVPDAKSDNPKNYRSSHSVDFEVSDKTAGKEHLSDDNMETVVLDMENDRRCHNDHSADADSNANLLNEDSFLTTDREKLESEKVVKEVKENIKNAAENERQTPETSPSVNKQQEQLSDSHVKVQEQLDEAQGLLKSAVKTGQSKEARLAKVCAGLSSRLQEYKAENKQLEELLVAERELTSSYEASIKQLRQDLSASKMEVARVESNLSDALAAKNSEIDTLVNSLDALKKEAAASEEKLASLQMDMDTVRRSRELTETRMIQALREELTSAERRAEEERTAHNATKMAAVEREVELEHRAVESSNALARIQRAADESTSRAAELEHKLALLEVEYASLNQELQDLEARNRVDRRNLLKILTKFFKRIAHYVTKESGFFRYTRDLLQHMQAWQEEVERARQGQREAENKLCYLEAELQKMRVEMAGMKRDAEHYSRQCHWSIPTFVGMLASKATHTGATPKKWHVVANLPISALDTDTTVRNIWNLRKRYRELTDLLYHKQTQLETMTSEKAALEFQLVKELNRLQEAQLEAERSRVTSRASSSWEEDTDMKALEPLPLYHRHMVGATKQLQRAAKLLDSGAVRATRFLWRYPTARVILLFYLVFVHLFLMYLLHHLQNSSKQTSLPPKKSLLLWDLASQAWLNTDFRLGTSCGVPDHQQFKMSLPQESVTCQFVESDPPSEPVVLGIARDKCSAVTVASGAVAVSTSGAGRWRMSSWRWVHSPRVRAIGGCEAPESIGDLVCKWTCTDWKPSVSITTTPRLVPSLLLRGAPPSALRVRVSVRDHDRDRRCRPRPRLHGGESLSRFTSPSSSPSSPQPDPGRICADLPPPLDFPLSSARLSLPYRIEPQICKQTFLPFDPQACPSSDWHSYFCDIMLGFRTWYNGNIIVEGTDSITKFGHVSSSSNVKPALVQKYCQIIDQILEHFKSVCDEIAASEISLDEQLVKGLEELDALVNEAREHVMSWYPLMSKIYFVLQIETIVMKICTSALRICQLVTPLLQSPIDSTTAKCIEETEYMNKEQISVTIEKAIRDQTEKDMPRPEHLDMISNSLSLSSNQELLAEVVALEKLKVEVGCIENQAEMETIDHTIALITYMHDCLVKVKQLHSINGVPIPADFCCPLSLELMSDPVIVASGQTYERAFIRKWLDQGFNVCPRTRQTLGHTNLIPNYTVKALIANWCESNNIKLPDPMKSTSLNLHSSFLKPTDANINDFVTHSAHVTRNHSRSSESHPRLVTSQSDLHTSNGVHQVTYLNEKPVSSPHHSSSGSLPVQIANGSEANIPRLSLESAEGDNESSMDQRHVSSSSQTVNQPKQDSEPSSVAEQFPGHNWTDSASLDISSINHLQGPEDANLVSRVSSDLTHCSSDAMGEVAQDSASSTSQRESEFPSALEDARFRSQSLWRRPSAPRIISSQSMDSRPDISGVEAQVRKLIEDLKSESLDLQITATAELRLLAKHNMENRIVIANCGVISLLVDLLHSTDSKIQENAVTALLNLSINDNNKIAIANAGAVDPLIYVLETGNPEAKENSAATLFSLSVIEENKVRIGRSRAIKPLVELLANGTPRGKKDAATALFNLSIFHENKSRIVQAGAVRHLVELMDPAAGMVDKAVAVLANLATIPEGRNAIGQAGGIPVLVEVVELGSARGKENAAAALLQLCTSGRFCSLVLQEGAVPPLVALSQSGTPRAKEKWISCFYWSKASPTCVSALLC